MIQTALDKTNRALAIVSAAEQDLDKVSEISDNAVQFANGLNQFADASQEAFQSITPTIRQNLLFVQQITHVAGDMFEQLKGTDWSKLPSADDIDRLTSRLGTAVKIMDSMSDLLGKIDALLPSHPLAARIQQLQTISEQLQQQIKLAGIISTALRENTIPPAEVVARLNEMNRDVNTGIDRFLSIFDSQIVPALTDATDQLKSVLSMSANTLQAAKERLPDIAAILATAKEGIQFGQAELEKFRVIYPTFRPRCMRFHKPLAPRVNPLFVL